VGGDARGAARRTIPVELYMVGNILFYAIGALGKEGALLLGGATGGVSYSKTNGNQQITKLEFLGTWSH
jgi:hypothetical protein